MLQNRERNDRMPVTHEERKSIADKALNPVVFFSYVLQFDDDGSFYVGSTNAPLTRFSEHAIGIGAKATSGRPFTVRLVLPFFSRKEAEYNEKRLRVALDKGPSDIEAMLAVFNRLIDVVRPQKTLSQLQAEERAYQHEMETVFHYSENLANFTHKPTACGYEGPHYGASDWDGLKKMARDEDFTGNIYGRKVCRMCLDHAPA